MIKILIGLIVLSLIVFFHELGHFVAAKLCGVEVESFSIGWGPVLFRKKKGNTEFRVSVIPIGGYCGMKGDKAFVTALEKNLSYIPKEQGGFYNASPLKRIIIAFAGPAANYLMAVAALAISAGFQSHYYTTSNKIVPMYCYDGGQESPAKAAELKIGDKIIEIDGKPISNFYEIMQSVIPCASKELTVKIERNGDILTKKITPKLDSKTGAGLIGIFSFIPLEIEEIRAGSSAETAGLKKGDIIVEANGKKVDHTVDFTYAAKAADSSLRLTVIRNGERIQKEISTNSVNSDEGLGFILKSEKVVIHGKSFFSSIAAGFSKANEHFVLVIRSLTLLFKGVDVKEAVSGPLRITHMIGESAASGFAESFSDGVSNLLTFISIICISLFIMNLLPVPILDGGLIFISLPELIFKKELHPKVLYYSQFIGFFFVAAVFGFALWSDIRFLISR